MSAVTMTGLTRLTIPTARDTLAAAIRTVCADLRLMDTRRAGLPDHVLIDLADDIDDAEIRDALRAGEITAATAGAYRIVRDATSAEFNAALAVTA